MMKIMCQKFIPHICDYMKVFQARRMVKIDPNGMISACTQLLSDLSSQRKDQQVNYNPFITDLFALTLMDILFSSCLLDAQEAALRVGDLYALLIEFYYKEGNFSLVSVLFVELQLK